MKIDQQKWQTAIEELFEDENELARKMRLMKSIDTKGPLAFVHWVIDNNWAPPGDDDDFYTNIVTGQQLLLADLKTLFNQSR